MPPRFITPCPRPVQLTRDTPVEKYELETSTRTGKTPRDDVQDAVRMLFPGGRYYVSLRAPRRRATDDPGRPRL